MADNPFAPPRVDVSGPLTGIGQNIADIVQQRRIQDARSSAMKLMQGGDTKGAFAQLMGAGDTTGMQALAGYVRSGQTAQTDQRDRAKGYIDSKTTDEREWLDTNPGKDPLYDQAKQHADGRFGWRYREKPR